MRRHVALAFALCFGVALRAQEGDKPGEIQAPLPEALSVPAAPVLSPAEALASFRLPDDLVIELVASEPLVEDPVAIRFDARGRLWVVEMRGFMPDVDGTNEQAPVGRVAVLSDTDGDGVMDARVDFLDELSLPRAVLPVRDGALVIAPPDLIFARDTDGDGRADLREVIDTNLGGLISPEHAPNALLPLLDNSVALANHDRRYEFRDGAWQVQRSVAAGQWGLTQDDLGRLFFNTNSDPLRAHLVDPAYALRHPSLRKLHGLNVGTVDDKRTWPARITPGVNRGYRPETLRDDYTLREVTAACGPWILRGDGLPAPYRGNAFVCEPAGNLVQRYVLSEQPDGSLRADNPHRDELDFLTSTDERFRPVQLAGGPDGALYITDMYRGILQHRIFLTSWLRAQILDRALDRPLGMGRIWRVRAKAPDERRAEVGARSASPGPPSERDPRPSLPEALPELVAQLGHANGWRRDRAQQMLVEQHSESQEVWDAVRAFALTSESPLGKLHALWTLEGWGQTAPDTLLPALSERDARVRHGAWRVIARDLARRPALLASLDPRASEPDPRVRLERVFALSGTPTTAGLDAALVALLPDVDRAIARSAFLSGTASRELEAIDVLLSEHVWRHSTPGARALLEALAELLGREARTRSVSDLLGRALDESVGETWQRAALIQGLLAARPKDALGKPSRLSLAAAPAVAPRLLAAASGPERELAQMLHWPGHPEALLGFDLRPLDATERARFARGQALYAAACATCHQGSGRGEPGKAPPLQGSQWVLGRPERLARILLHGMQGALERDGEAWDLDMPALPLGDDDLAALLTYVRREWGHGADPVEPATVASERAATLGREDPWTVAELEAMFDR